MIALDLLDQQNSSSSSSIIKSDTYSTSPILGNTDINILLGCCTLVCQDNEDKIRKILNTCPFTKSQKQWIIRVYNQKIEWHIIPDTWYQLLIENEYMTIKKYGAIKVAIYLWRKLRYGEKVEIHHKDLKKINRNYIAIIDLLHNLKENRLIIPKDYYAGNLQSVNEPIHARFYQIKIKAKPKTNTIALPSDQIQFMRTDTKKTSQDSFSDWQKKQFEHLDFDFKNALQMLNPSPINGNHLQLLMQLLCIYKKDYYIKSSQFGRIFHNFSNLKKEYRQFIYLQNESCLEIDLRASQPAFFAYALNKISKYPDQIKREIEDYTRVCLHVRIYDYLFAKYQSRCTKDAFKKSFMTYLYAQVTIANSTAAGKCFIEEWPLLAAQIDLIKKARGHQKLAHAMQMAEAEFIFDCVKKFHFPAITIHDGIMVARTHVEFALNIVSENLKKWAIPTIATVK